MKTTCWQSLNFKHYGQKALKFRRNLMQQILDRKKWNSVLLYSIVLVDNHVGKDY